MSRDPRVAEIVSALVGTWSGKGEGLYPTITAFVYREVSRFEARDDHPALLYEQRTWRETPEGEVVSHWETGLLRLSSDGSALFHNSQSGRVEAMTGTWKDDSGIWTISLEARGFAGDDRMIGSRRTIQVTDDRLSYTMHMETTSTHASSLHLKAELSKVRSD